ncbi:uncharacterized protein LOC112905276 [Agrilus planipennis]|uniref:Uncharacterized protein LOC112905276 n=1 Tax=Agrilus planipennis TaxID=224129 RepID=A0A7F5RB24_AGRPL|nr:uncharacterized protein LOC112905276 [Agrilus planipennis]
MEERCTIEEVTARNIKAFEAKIFRELKILKSELSEMKISYAALSDRCQDIQKENAALRITVSSLQEAHATQLSRVAAELEDRRRRRKNIILTGLIERTAPTPKRRAEIDRNDVFQSLTNICPTVETDDLRHVSRLDDKTENRNRAVKVTLSSPELASKILCRGRRQPSPTVKVLNDRTPAQQLELETLRRELATRQAAGHHLTIRYTAAATINISFLYTNIATLMTKFDQLEIEVTQKKPTIVVITETWLRDDIPDTLVNIPGVKKGGGVMFYVLNNLDGANISATPLVHLQEPRLEALWLKITIRDLTFVVAGIYRPPTKTYSVTPTDTLLFEVLRRVGGTKTPTFIFGDFNFPDTTWEHGLPQSPREVDKAFIEALLDSNLEQLIREPTRHRGVQTPSILDFVLTNEPQLLSSPKLHPAIGGSDHQDRIPFFKLDYSTISARIPDRLPPPMEDLIQTYDDFTESLTSLLREAAPPSRRVCRKRPLKPWVTNDILSNITKKKRLWEVYKRTKTPAAYQNYRAHSNSLSNIIRLARKQYETEIAAKGGKLLYAYLSRASTSHSPVPNAMKKGDLEITNPSDIAELFADTFAEVYTTEPSGPLPSLGYPPQDDHLSDIDFSVRDVEEVLRSFDSSACSGPDGIPSVVLKNCAETLAPFLHTLFRQSLDKGTIPENWRRATITPIFKKGSRHLASNYRPISLTSATCKVLERLLAKEILEFALQKGIIPPQQHGFVPGRSISSNMLLCLDDWAKAVDSGIPVDIVYLDFSKAFDKVPQRRLLQKLHHLEIRGKLLAWIEAYMRRLRVGFPGALFLVPCFLTFTHPTCTCEQHPSTRHTRMKIYGNPLTHGDSIQQDLDNLALWSHDWMIPLNPGKCTVLHLGMKKNPHRVYHLGNLALAPVTSQVDLGIIVSDDLKWDLQTTAVVKKTNSFLYRVRKAVVEVDIPLLRNVLTTYVLPMVEYGSTVLATYLQKDIKALEGILRRALMIPRTLKSLPYEERLRRLGLQSLADRRLFADLTETYRILHGMYRASDLQRIFLRSTSQRGHNLRLNVSRFKTQHLEYHLGNRVISTWNSLPASIAQAPSIDVFKASLHRHLFGSTR